jgi:hypothetical protein
MEVRTPEKYEFEIKFYSEHEAFRYSRIISISMIYGDFFSQVAYWEGGTDGWTLTRMDDNSLLEGIIGSKKNERLVDMGFYDQIQIKIS